MELLHNVSAVTDKYTDIKLIIYDLGLYKSQIKEVKR
jgi:hypothetical protein